MKVYQVLIINSKELQREVKVSVFLPKNYDNTEKNYPVLYLHDGQNLFDDDLAKDGKSWGIIEAYENDINLPKIIIIGINSVDTRTEELVPFVFKTKINKELHGGNSDNYYNFITKTLKPVIDNKYRTFLSADKTGIMGSSYGGLSSTYAALRYSKYFTRFGCVSNAYSPVINEIEELILSTTFSTVKKFYMDVGTKETESKKHNNEYITLNMAVFELLSNKMEPHKLRFEIINDAIHNESAWEKRFPDIVKYLFSD